MWPLLVVIGSGSSGYGDTTMRHILQKTLACLELFIACLISSCSQLIVATASGLGVNNLA